MCAASECVFLVCFWQRMNVLFSYLSFAIPIPAGRRFVSAVPPQTVLEDPSQISFEGHPRELYLKVHFGKKGFSAFFLMNGIWGPAEKGWRHIFSQKRIKVFLSKKKDFGGFRFLNSFQDVKNSTIPRTLFRLFFRHLSKVRAQKSHKWQGTSLLLISIPFQKRINRCPGNDGPQP